MAGDPGRCDTFLRSAAWTERFHTEDATFVDLTKKMKSAP